MAASLKRRAGLSGWIGNFRWNRLFAQQTCRGAVECIPNAEARSSVQEQGWKILHINP